MLIRRRLAASFAVVVITCASLFQAYLLASFPSTSVQVVEVSESERQSVRGAHTQKNSTTESSLLGDREGDRQSVRVAHTQNSTTESLLVESKGEPQSVRGAHTLRSSTESSLLVESESERQSVRGAPTQETKLDLLRFADWPTSQRETLWKNYGNSAGILSNVTSGDPLHCPRCLSFLAGAAHGKRILLLGHSTNVAGGEIFLFNLVELLEQSGALARVLFLVSHRQPMPGPLLQEHQDKGHSYLFWNQTSPSLVNFDDFDLVIANTLAIDAWHNFFGITKSLLSAKKFHQLMEKTIYWVHEIDTEIFLNNVSVPVLSQAKHVLFDSHAALEKNAEVLPVIRNKSSVIWLGVRKQQVDALTGKLTLQDKQNLRKKLGIPVTGPDDVVMLQASTYIAHKGLANLTRAFGNFIESLNHSHYDRNWFLVFVGFQLPGQEVLEAVHEVNHRLKGLGTLSRVIAHDTTMDMPPYYLASDVFFLNTVCESFGMVIAEAMFAGLPVVARDCGGPREQVVHQKTGLLIDPSKVNNQVALTSAMQQLTTGKNWREKLSNMGKSATERAKQNFSYARMARETSNIITQFLYFDNSRKDSWRCSAALAKENGGHVTVEKNFERSFSSWAAPPDPTLSATTSYDLRCVSIGDDFYILGGYTSIDNVTKRAERYSLSRNEWRSAPPLPDAAAESHTAVTNDDRYIYLLSGQRGAQCNPPINASFVFDSIEQEWREIPALPVARYAACAAVMGDRLHFVGGMDVDRRTPRTEHYSLSLPDLKSFLSGGAAAAPEWRLEPPIPSGSGHAFCQVLSGKLYYFGGEAEDFYAQDPDSGNFDCTPGLEWNNPFVYIYDGSTWSRGPDMPYPLSHVDGFSMSTSRADNDVTFLLGGSGPHEDFIPDHPILSDGILMFSAKSQRFERIGSLYPVGFARKAACGTGWIVDHNSSLEHQSQRRHLRLLVIGGQASATRSVPWPGPIEPFTMICDAPGIPWLDNNNGDRGPGISELQ